MLISAKLLVAASLSLALTELGKINNLAYEEKGNSAGNPTLFSYTYYLNLTLLGEVPNNTISPQMQIH